MNRPRQSVDTEFSKYMAADPAQLWVHVTCGAVVSGSPEELPAECPQCWIRARLSTHTYDLKLLKSATARFDALGNTFRDLARYVRDVATLASQVATDIEDGGGS